MLDKDLDDIQEMINQHHIELENEQNELLEKIKSGNATAEDYIEAASNMLFIHKSPDKQQLNEFLETGARLAQKNITSSSMAERASAFATLATYHEIKKEYKEALKCFDEAIDAGGKEFIVLRARLRVKYFNDRKGAKKDYELAAQAGLPDEELKLFDLIVNNEKTFNDKALMWLKVILIIAAIAALTAAEIYFN